MELVMNGEDNEGSTSAKGCNRLLCLFSLLVRLLRTLHGILWQMRHACQHDSFGLLCFPAMPFDCHNQSQGLCPAIQGWTAELDPSMIML